MIWSMCCTPGTQTHGCAARADDRLAGVLAGIPRARHRRRSSGGDRHRSVRGEGVLQRGLHPDTLYWQSDEPVALDEGGGSTSQVFTSPTFAAPDQPGSLAPGRDDH